MKIGVILFLRSTSQSKSCSLLFIHHTPYPSSISFSSQIAICPTSNNGDSKSPILGTINLLERSPIHLALYHAFYSIPPPFATEFSYIHKDQTTSTHTNSLFDTYLGSINEIVFPGASCIIIETELQVDFLFITS